MGLQYERQMQFDYLKFFLKENLSCLCSLCPIKSRQHILHECRRYNNYWNPNRKSFSVFLEFNPRAFSSMKESLNSSFFFCY